MIDALIAWRAAAPHDRSKQATLSRWTSERLGHTAGEGGITWNFSRATCIFIGVLGVFGVFQQILIGEEGQNHDTPPIFHGVFWCVWGVISRRCWRCTTERAST